MGALTYRNHQARRLRELAKIEEFQDAQGGPDFVKLAREVGITAECARYILTGALAGQETSEDIFE